MAAQILVREEGCTTLAQLAGVAVGSVSLPCPRSARELRQLADQIVPPERSLLH